ncbi:MAG TPA: amino acid adenylation domain-containing protein, partial [Kofleriaceae bacterium]
MATLRDIPELSALRPHATRKDFCARTVEATVSRRTAPQLTACLRAVLARYTDHADLLDGDSPVAAGELQFAAWERGDELRLCVAYDEDRYDHELVEQFVRHFLRVLDLVAREPQRSLAALDILDEDDHRRLRLWNATARPIPEPHTIHALVAEQIVRTPEAIAVVCADVRLTYRELGARVERVAGWLSARGVTRGDRVAVAVDRTADMVVAVLAVLRIGAAYVPIDPEYPAQRQAFVRSDAGAVLELTDSTLREALISTTIAPSTRVDESDVAYVLYTSGSTGNPKGVRVPHRAVVNFLRSMQRAPGLAASDTLVAVTTLSFDIAGLELYLPLVTGATLVIANRETTRDGRLLARLLATSGATVMQATPATWRMLLAAEWRPAPHFKILCGGEALPPELATQLLDGAGAVWNMYGPTETTIWSTCAQLAPGQPITLGRPIDNTTLYVLDDARRLAPIGVAGELYIGGSGVALGYSDRPELTAERFLADPFTPGRMYRTGDRVRWLPDGTLAYLGRIDNQIKLRGFRIELGEIESTLRALTHVTDAAVVLREDTPGNPQLIAYVIAAPDLDVASLSTTLAAALPEYMVPSAFVTLASFPLTPNGKLDRNAFPAPHLASAPYVAPRDATEAALVAIWQELLGVERIGVHDDFFALGGHSLLATRLLTQLRTRFAVELSVRTVFDAKTVEGLAPRIATSAASATPPLVRAEQRSELSFTERRLWFLHELDPESLAYQIAYARRLEGIDVETLRRAFELLVHRHESLRTTFPARDGEPYRHVHPPTRWTLDVYAGQAEAQRRPFDIATGPLLRTHAVRVSDDTLVLYVTLHHIITDGWSDEILWRELWASYDALASDRRPDLAPLPVQYADYATWQRSWLQGAELERQLSFWTAQLDGAPDDADLPFKGPRPPRQTFGGRTIAVTLDAGLADRIRMLRRREGASNFMIFAASLRAALARYTGQADLLVGTAVANRDAAELEGVIGPFINTLVLRNELRAGDTFAALLAREKAHALAAFEHSHTPFELVVDALGLERSISRPPLFQVMYVHQGVLDGEMRGQPVALEPVAMFDLNFETFERGEQLGLSLTYNVDLFEHALVEQLVRDYLRLLDRVTRDAHGALAEIDLLDEDAHHRLHALNATEHPFDDALVPAIVEAQVDRTPDAIAVECEGSHLTFRELDVRANQLAHALRARKVGTDQPVLVLLERSLDLAVAILAIAKAGAAYLPIDPATPRARVRHIAIEANAHLVVGHHAFAALVDDLPVDAIWLDAHRTALADYPTSRPPVVIDPDSLLYVLYTSGSTGTPKGVMVTHRAFANHMRWMLGELAFSATDVVLQRTPYQFDASGWELWAPLMCGARMVMVGPDRHGDPHHLVQTIREHGVTVAQFVPTLLAALLDEESLADTTLTRVFCGGEALTGALVRRFDAGPTCELVNLYGPTETTIDATMARVPRDIVGEHVSIGRPV